MKNKAQHIAIIMDGNGRWAKARGHSRLWGHIRGAKVAREIIEACADLKIKNLTLFAFSSENWRRPQTEVSFLMRLLKRQLKREVKKLIKNNIRFNYIGDISQLPKDSQEAVLDAVEATSTCTGMALTFALNYGGRQDIVSAVKHVAKKVSSGELTLDAISEDLISKELDSSFLPDPDLPIRTSGETRLSNFFLWQSAYSELEFSPVLWPDFGKKHFLEILDNFSKRERRFGQTSAQLNQTSPTDRSL